MKAAHRFLAELRRIDPSVRYDTAQAGELADAIDALCRGHNFGVISLAIAAATANAINLSVPDNPARGRRIVNELHVTMRAMLNDMYAAGMGPPKGRG